MKVSILLLLTLVAANLAVTQPLSTDAILGKAGDTYVTEDEFIRRFELMPGLNRSQGPKLDEEKLMVFYSIVAEKLLAQEASARGMDADSLFLASMADMEKLLARDELYRQEVTGKVRVSEAEIQEGIRRARRELFVTFLYSDSAAEAAFVRKRIATVGDFNRLQVDSSMDIVRDTATIIWGDANAAIEDAAYRLQAGETSPVVKAENGYYVLHLTRERQNGYYTTMKPEVLRERVTQRLAQRKEKVRLNQYMASILKGKTGYARPVPFRILARALQETYERHTDQSGITLNDTLLAEVRTRLGNSVRDTLIVAGKTVWSVARVLERLATNGFTLLPSEVQELPVRLDRQLRIWVWQELLAQEALRRGMDQHPAVRKDIEEWRQSFLSQFMKRHVAKSVKVNDEEVMAYAKRQGDSLWVPVVQIRELRTESAVEMQDALADLEKNVPFTDVIRRWSNDPAAKQRDGLSDFFPITDRSPVGQIAGQMKVGEFYGPLTVQGGILYFKLEARKDASPVRDTSAAARLATARQELLSLKTKRTLNLLLAQSGQKRGFTVYQDRLKEIKVSAVPMMTFRVLGFGGRIWGAPMLEKQVEWLTIEPPATQVVP